MIFKTIVEAPEKQFPTNTHLSPMKSLNGLEKTIIIEFFREKTFAASGKFITTQPPLSQNK
jgi:hypothetical protein